MADGKKVIVRQVRSSNRRIQKIKDTLNALGLGKIGQTKEHQLNDCVYGMLKKVRHLVEVKEI